MNVYMRILAWTSTALLLVGCGGGGSGSGESPLRSNLIIHADATSGLLVQARADTGELVEYFGERDAEGVPSKVNTVVIHEVDGGELLYELDETGRPRRFVSSDGVEFRLDWKPDGTVHVTMTSADGQIQVLGTVDPKKGEGDAPLVTSASLRPARGVSEVSSQLAPVSPTSHIIQDRPSMSESDAGVVDVHMDRCGAPDPFRPYTARITLFDDAGDVAQYPATHVGEGIYRAHVPTGLRHISPTAEVCERISGVMGELCLAYVAEVPAAGVMCAQIAFMISAVGLPPVGGGFALACTVLVGGWAFYCGVLGAGPAPGSSDSLFSSICQADFVRYSESEWETMVVSVFAPGLRPPVHEAFEVSGSTFEEALEVLIEAPGEPFIDRQLPAPFDPAPREGYTYAATLSCLPTGTVVTLTVEGTDSYNDAASEILDAPAARRVFSIVVPGSEAGVQDTVEVRVELPDGQVLTQTGVVDF